MPRGTPIPFETRQAVRADRAARMTKSAIARRYGVSVHAVELILRAGAPVADAPYRGPTMEQLEARIAERRKTMPKERVQGGPRSEAAAVIRGRGIRAMQYGN